MQGERNETTPAKKTRPMDTLNPCAELDAGRFVFDMGEAILRLMGVENWGGRKAIITAVARINHPVMATKSLLL